MKDKRACKLLRNYISALKQSTYGRQDSSETIADFYFNVEIKHLSKTRELAMSSTLISTAAACIK